MKERRKAVLHDHREPFRIVLAPSPITPSVAWNFFIHQRAGRIASDPYVFTRQNLQSTPLAEPSILKLFGSPLEEGIAVGGESCVHEIPRLRRLFNFLRSPSKEQKASFDAFARNLAGGSHSPKATLMHTSEYFGALLRNPLDPFAIGLPELELGMNGQEPITFTPPPSMCRVRRPVFENKAPGVHHLDDPIIGMDFLHLHEDRIGKLVGRHLGVIIGGPPNSNKSMVADVLKGEIEDAIWSLQHRHGWGEFSLSIETVNLDLASPIDENGKRLKQRVLWTSEMAFQALDTFTRAKEANNLVIADMPGELSEITEIVASPADAAVIVTNDWGVGLESWQEFLGRMGIEELSRIHSTAAGRNKSLVRAHHGKVLFGQITPIRREAAPPPDFFISYLAKVILFDLLPSLVSRREKRATAQFGAKT